MITRNNFQFYEFFWWSNSREQKNLTKTNTERQKQSRKDKIGKIERHKERNTNWKVKKKREWEHGNENVK